VRIWKRKFKLQGRQGGGVDKEIPKAIVLLTYFGLQVYPKM
jgi:hypothetical protein